MIKFPHPSSPHKKSGNNSGNIFFMLFGAVALVGAIGVGASNHMKGIVGSMSDVTRKTVAEEKMMGGARLSVMAATDVQANEGDCDSDGMVEPLPFVDAGAAPKPAGGGWMPTDIGAEALDPWGQKYGYCVWDAGSQFDHAGCGGPGARRLRGSPNPTHTVVAIISPGKNRAFETTCNAYVDTTPADGNPDTPLITRGANYDDIVLEYTYEDASGLSGEDLWKIRDTDPDTATIDKNIEVSGSGTFDGAINLMEKGLILPSDPGDNSVTGICAAANDQQLRINGGVSPPALEICYSNAWSPVSMSGGGGGGSPDPEQTAKILASDAAANDNFGESVAIDGNTAIVGAAYEDGGPASGKGAAYIFVKSGGTWVQQQKLVASDAAAGAYFGWSVDIDGDSVVIGARSDSGAGVQAGAAYVFTRSGSVWTQQQKLTASDAAAGHGMGYTVRIYGDTVAAAAPGESSVASYSGAIYAFTRSGSVWTQQQKLKASDAAASDLLGTRKGLDLDGDTILAGAEGSDAGGSNSGAAYVFTRSGSVWTQQQKLTASDLGATDAFGAALALSGNTAVITSRLDDDVEANSGAAYIFTRSGSVWTQQQKLKASDATASDLLGYGVGISGNVAIIGTSADSDVLPSAGAAYVFRNAGGVWTQIAKITASDAIASHNFGGDVAISDDTAIAGAIGDNDGGSFAGAAYIFEGMCFGEPCVMAENLQPAVSHPLASEDFLGCTAAAQGPFKKVSEMGGSIHSRIFYNGQYYFSADASSNLHALQLNNNGTFTSIANTGLGAASNSLWANSSYVYSVTAGNELKAFSFNGTSFTAAGTATLPASTNNIFGQGGYIFASASSGGLVAYRHDGYSFTQVGVFDPADQVQDVWGDGQYLYVANEGGGFLVLSFDGTDFAQIDQIVTPGAARSSWGDGKYLYVTAVNGLYAYSFINNELSLVGSYASANPMRQIWGTGNAIMVGETGTGVLKALSFSGTAFSLLAEYPGLSANVTSVTGDGNYIYVTWSATRNLTILSGFGCGESMSPDPAVIIAANRYRGKISAGRSHVCGLKSDTTGWCWGSDSSEALGNGTRSNLSYPSIVDSASTTNSFTLLGSGFGFSCGLQVGGSAWCWGSDANGELGNGAGVTANQSAPYLVTGGHLWSFISAGSNSACAIKIDGTAWCWGTDAFGELGNGASGAQTSPFQVNDVGPWVFVEAGAQHGCGIKTDGSAWCWGRNDLGQLGTGATGGAVQSPTPVAEPGPWVQITAGNSFTCGIKADGSAWCWGQNTYGQLGNGSKVNSSKPLRVYDSGPWITIESTLYDTHTCAIKVDGSAWCWGRDSKGQLGNGAASSADQTVPDLVLDPGPWSTLSLTFEESCGIKVDGSAWCWGSDASGVLGNGTGLTADQTVPSRVTNFSNLEPWQWDASATTMSKAITTAPVVIPPSSAMGYKDSAGGLSFNNGTQSILRNANGDAELLVESLDTSANVQISFKAISAGNTRSLALDGTTGNLKIGLNTSTLTTWASALTAQMLVTYNGDVAMGTTSPAAKLSITNGGLRVGLDNRTCTPSRTGTLSFDEAQAVDFKYCNGSAWVDF